MRLSALVAASDGGLGPVGVSVADPDVTAVVTTDLLAPGRYLSGGELVLTGLAWWRPDREDRTGTFVAALVEAGVVALAAGEAELGEVPTDLVRACQRAGLPLLRVPVAVSFSAIMERCDRLLSRPRSGDLAAVLARHRGLMAAATARDSAGLARPAGLTGDAGGLVGVLEWVDAELGLRCWVLSPAGRLIGGSAPAPDGRQRRQIARHYRRAPRLPHRLVRPGHPTLCLFGAGGGVTEEAGPGPDRIGAWLVVVAEDPRDWTGERRHVVDELVSLVAVERDLAGRRSTTERQLALALAGASAAEAAAAVRRCGLDPDTPSVLLVGHGRLAGPVLAEALAGQRGPWAAADADGTWYGLVSGGEASELVSRIRDVVENLVDGPEPLRIGVSDPVAGGDGLLAGVAEAAAVAAAAAGGPGLAGRPSVAGPELLSSPALLLASVPAEVRHSYAQRVLGPLLAHDRAHRTQFTRTLAAYLDCSGSWSRCAAQLHVHVNTLRYRIERIEALTGRDLRRLADQAALLLALRLIDPPD
ncbi:MAG TPA: PucR family transcriptional regulator [Micromonosporaceae bacterium]